MAYNNAIPQPNDTLAASQPQLLGNFAEIDTFLNVNHVGFGGGEQGKHKWVTMPNQGVAPATANAEVALFGFISPETGVSELYFRRPTSGTQIPMTERDGTNAGWTMLPSGILMKWGIDTANGVVTIDANATGKAITEIYALFLTDSSNAVNDDTYISGNILTLTTFRVAGVQRSAPATAKLVGFSWLVIGV